MLDTLIGGINTITRWTGERIKWLTTGLVLLIFCDVLLRYLFSESRAWMTELEWYVFALIFLLGGAFVLKEDRHVRVDIFYAKWSDTRKAWTDLLGAVLFLIPWSCVIIYTSFRYAENAFMIGERSSEPGGLAARWVIKGAITLGFILLLLQAFSVVLTAIKTITHRRVS